MKQNRTTHKEPDPNAKVFSESTHPAATTMEARENELISLAYDAAEERIRNGTATSQEIVHFLKLGSSSERLQKKLMESDMQLKQAKVQAIESAERLEKEYAEAIDAMKRYSGAGDSDEQ